MQNTEERDLVSEVEELLAKVPAWSRAWHGNVGGEFVEVGERRSARATGPSGERTGGRADAVS